MESLGEAMRVPSSCAPPRTGALLPSAAGAEGRIVVSCGVHRRQRRSRPSGLVALLFCPRDAAVFTAVLTIAVAVGLVPFALPHSARAAAAPPPPHVLRRLAFPSEPLAALNRQRPSVPLLPPRGGGSVQRGGEIRGGVVGIEGSAAIVVVLTLILHLLLLQGEEGGDLTLERRQLSFEPRHLGGCR